MSLLKNAPQLTADQAGVFVRELYGLQTVATPMPSERDQNFLMMTQLGERFVLKVANALEDRSLLEAQNLAMAQVYASQPVCPQVIRTRRGELIAEIQSPIGTKHFVRLLTYLEGVPLGEIRRQSDDLLRSLGQRVGLVDRTLTKFDHPALHRDFHWDLANALKLVRQYEALIDDAELRLLVTKLTAFFERSVEPLLPTLRTSIIHNDANNFNVIVSGGDGLRTRNQQVVGLIDFGDMLHSYTVGGLGVAIAYAILDKPDPLHAAEQVLSGYYLEYPLLENEITALFGLVCMRLCASVCIAAHQTGASTGNEYLAISQQAIRRTLPKLATIQPRFAEAAFRNACGLSPVPQAARIIDWLQHAADPHRISSNFDVRTDDCVVFDLSVGSPLVQCGGKNGIKRSLSQHMKSVGASIGIGQYAEPRLRPTMPTVEEQSTIHLGMDLFAEAGASFCAPFDGIVHAFSGNAAVGYTLLLQHKTDQNEIFYTLYKYLREISLTEMFVGQQIARGEVLGAIGLDSGNEIGDVPHMHFQIIIDLLDLDCYFPAYCQASQREVWTCLSLDPNLILKIPTPSFPIATPGKLDTLTARQQLIGRNLSLGYTDPVKVERGWMQYLFDETGRQYLDAYNNVPHIGHCHPRVVEAGQQQLSVLNTNTRYLHDALNRYAEKIISTLPEPLRVCFFVNSGSEANELALRLARAHTQQRDMIVLENAYHGNTTTLIDISPYKHNGPGGTGAPSWVHSVPIADTYRGPYRADDPQAAQKYAWHVKDVIAGLQRITGGLAGFIAESCPSVGGQIILPAGYLDQVYRSVRAAGGVCIADEVQTGYGRTGTDFYAFEAQAVVPDIVVLGKPIGNGYPIGAVITTPAIAASFNNGMEFFSTFGGSTVSCAIGLAVLSVVLEEELQAHALQVGKYLLAGLQLLKDRYPIVGDVRGSGLFIGVELVRDRSTLEPASIEAAFIANRMREQSILLGTDGPSHNVIKIRPPMPFTQHDADYLLDRFDKVLAADFAEV